VAGQLIGGAASAQAGDVIVDIEEEHGGGGAGPEDPQRGREAAAGEDQCSSRHAEENDP